MSKPSMSKLFHGKLTEFVSMLKINFGHVDKTLNTELIQYTKAVDFYQKNPKQLASIFYLTVYLKYSKQIMENDEDFFLNQDFTGEAGEDESKKEDIALKTALLRQIWNSGVASPELKDDIFTKMKVLCKLTERAVKSGEITEEFLGKTKARLNL